MAGATWSVAAQSLWSRVILEFPDRAMLDAFYHGPDYAPLIAMRAGATLSRVALIDGYTT